jgi:hypothetical protein
MTSLDLTLQAHPVLGLCAMFALICLAIALIMLAAAMVVPIGFAYLIYLGLMAMNLPYWLACVSAVIIGLSLCASAAKNAANTRFVVWWG